MTLAFTSLKFLASPTDATSYLIAGSFTPPANQLLIAYVLSGRSGAVPSAPTSITGNSATWTLIDSETFDPIGSSARLRLSVWKAVVASPTAGQITISFGSETQTLCGASIFAVTATSNPAEVVGSAVKVSSDATDTLAATLPGAGEGAVYGVAKDSTSGMGPGAGSAWTEITEQGSGTAPAFRFTTQFVDSPDTTASCTWNPSANAACAGIALEVKEAGVAPTAKPFLYYARMRRAGAH